ncbi:MAG: 2-oxoglutarate synthase [Deltaproteobacteria bacterium]|jgi:2-oxoglutarate ferredoxin oxidoreductase subunit beta|nr:2-oxoglutarate synthase [Deltaproteobacteria bacterium]MBP1716904.1 2-oxoglutarate synthase [Deltaproteobacteria bacterium]
MNERVYQMINRQVFPTPFCPGCGHGILMNAVLRALSELEYDIKNMVFVSGIGCAAWIPSPHFKADTLHTLHGRAIAYATGAKLFNPKLKIMVISGDGDLSAIGGNHLIHAARRNMDMTVVCANNGIYGMTGGQVASTTPIGSRTSTTPKGNQEPPFDLCKLVEAAGATFVARQPVVTPIPLTRTLKKAIVHRGFSFIDVLSPCPTQFGRRNAFRTPHDMLVSLKNTCVSVEKAKTMTPEDVKGKILVGEFVSQGEGGQS